MPHPFDEGFKYQTNRVFYALQEHKRYILKMEKWLTASRESSNFTYDLDPINVKYLASFVAVVTKRPIEEIEGYVAEILSDQEINELIRNLVTQSNMQFWADAAARFGRRIGWYAIARATKPKIVIETGVDKGLGSCVIASALDRNRNEGHPGYLYSVDINPNAGAFFTRSRFREVGELVISDSLKFLTPFDKPIDFFISDSDHSHDYEAREYETVANKMAHAGILLSDNAHVSEKLHLFAKANKKNFLYFQEKPVDHIYPGAGMGVCFDR